MENYYTLLDINQDACEDEINKAYKNKLIEFKYLPFLTENDNNNLKKIKKAFFIFNNPEYKKIYDEHLQNKFKKEINNSDNFYIGHKKKNIDKQNYLVDRIFEVQTNNSTPKINLSHNELLRPQNVSLSSDKKIEFDKPLNFVKNNDIKAFNYDS